MLAEHRTMHPVKEPNPAGIPARWLRFLYRVAGLERGFSYNIVVFVPKHEDDPVKWVFMGEGKIENDK